MMTKNEIISRYEELNFIVVQKGVFYSIRMPDFCELTDYDKEVHELIIGRDTDFIATIEHMLVLLLKNGLITIED